MLRTILMFIFIAEIFGFLDQSQQCLNPPCDGHSGNTTDSSPNRTAGAAGATWQDCGPNCQNCSLDRYYSGIGVCDLCLPGFYYFNKNCESCRTTCLQINATDDFTCDQNDGTCLYGCMDGWYGEPCNIQCSPLCINGTCNRDNGCCTVDYCKYNNLGGCKCLTPCNSNCVNSTCNQNLTCSQGCKVNTWGPDCSQTCSISCKPAPDNTTSSCDRQGLCLFGCQANVTDPRCSVSCPDNCRQGTCDTVSGACLDGCVAGYTGRFCNETACGDGGVLQTHDRRNTSSLLEIIFNRLDPNVKTIKIVFN